MKRTAFYSCKMKALRFGAIFMMVLAFLAVCASNPDKAFAEGSDITSMSFELVDPTLYEDLDGGFVYSDYEWNEEKGEYVGVKGYFQYECLAVICDEGSVLNITRGSGTKAYTADPYQNGFVSEDGELIDLNDLVVNCDQSFENQWKPGEKRSFTVTYKDVTCTVNVTIAANPIESISFTPANEAKLIENVSGYWDEFLGTYNPDTGEYEGKFDYFIYEVPQFSMGDQLTVKYRDGGDPSVYTLREYGEEGTLTSLAFVDGSGNMISPYQLSIETDQSYDNPWGPGLHTYDVIFCSRRAAVPIEVIAAEITDIKYIRKSGPMTAYEGYGCEARTQSGEPYFCYYHPDFEYGDIIEVTFSGGRTESYEYIIKYDDNGQYSSFFGARDNDIEKEYGEVKLDSRQDKTHWAPGADNKLYLSVGTFETSVPVEILENPVRSAVLNMDHEVIFKPDSAVIRTGDDGQPFKYYPLDEEEEYGAIFGEGDSITVEFKTGETVVYTYSRYGRFGYGFYDEEENKIYPWCYSVTSDQYSDHWTVGANNPLHISYLGHEMGPVNVVLDLHDISGCVIDVKDELPTYTGQPIEPEVTVFDEEDDVLKEGVDYTVTYHNNINVDTIGDGAWAEVEGIGKYYGTEKLSFWIQPKAVKEKQIEVESVTTTYDGKAHQPAVKSVKVNGVLLSKDDYDLEYMGWVALRNPRDYGVNVVLKRNYSGMRNVGYYIIPAATSITKLKPAKKAFTVSWKKKTKQTTGYQIQYSLNKNFKGAKSVIVSSKKTTSKKISKLKSKKRYYVRVRTYKKVDGKKIYSKWSKMGTVKTK